jgi:NADP-dependent 3-hydroxy acid dehydrogenase YdfG
MTISKDQVAVISGGGTGMGKAIALKLSAQGAKVYILGRNLENLLSVKNNSEAIAGEIIPHQMDITEDAEIEKLKGQIENNWGRVDLLIHSAGIISLGDIKTSPVEDFDKQYRTNVRAPYVLTQALLPMLISSQGQIVVINSTAGLNAAKAGVSQYAATKHALKAFTDSLRAEVNAEGVRVISVYPGRTASPMQAKIYEMEGRGEAYNPQRLMQAEDIADVVINALALPKTAEVTDIQVRPMMKS